jgi:hypothetical protein
MVAFHQVAPEPSGFAARCGKCLPCRGSTWHPVYFYRTIAHIYSIA